LVSIHINSLTENGVAFDIAATQTFYTDETAWGADVTARLAQGIQDGVVAEMADAADYRRQDRGIQAQNLYIVAPPLLEPTPDRPDPRKQPTRGALMPSVLTEVGSITSRRDQTLLGSPAGQRAAAAGIFDALAGYFGDRPLAASYLLPDVDPVAGVLPDAQPGGGPPFWPPSITDPAPLVRFTNTGTQAWPQGLSVVGAWQASEWPYLRVPPDDLQDVLADGASVPALQPGESVDLPLSLPDAGSDPGAYWITLSALDGPLTELGSPPLQLGTGR
ncbi:MAG TPA: N-acetylmuramoyl-L-alanine amidase, partial [Candidatus Limnocylindria bacterium]|nr:N-acetylmuramoyl-L-alanine amidase [Candidatus Limnocylindria bacterium]